MKQFFLFLFLFAAHSAIAQAKFTGAYNDHFGNEIRIYPDGYFDYYLRSDTEVSWSYGSWTTKNDSIFFNVIVIRDSIAIHARDSVAVYSNAPALASYPSVKTKQLSGFQNLVPIPHVLFYKNTMLFYIGENGKVRNRKVYSPLIHARISSQFFPVK